MKHIVTYALRRRIYTYSLSWICNYARDQQTKHFFFHAMSYTGIALIHSFNGKKHLMKLKCNKFTLYFLYTVNVDLKLALLDTCRIIPIKD